MENFLLTIRKANIPIYLKESLLQENLPDYSALTFCRKTKMIRAFISIFQSLFFICLL